MANKLIIMRSELNYDHCYYEGDRPDVSLDIETHDYDAFIAKERQDAISNMSDYEIIQYVIPRIKKNKLLMGRLK